LAHGLDLVLGCAVCGLYHQNGMSTEEEFSVWIFFPDGTHLAELRWVDAEAALECARFVIARPAARLGIINKVIITDGGDYTAFEWQYGKGVTFPNPNAEQTNGTSRAIT
jgi:hypothetical protein